MKGFKGICIFICTMLVLIFWSLKRSTSRDIIQCKTGLISRHRCQGLLIRLISIPPIRERHMLWDQIIVIKVDRVIHAVWWCASVYRERQGPFLWWDWKSALDYFINNKCSDLELHGPMKTLGLNVQSLNLFSKEISWVY